MRAIEIMLADGMLGPKAMLLALSALTTGNLNAKIQKTAKPFQIQDVLPSAHDYIVPPLSEEQKREQVNNQLLAFIAMKPGSEGYIKA